MIRHLLSLKIDINKRDKYGDTPLYSSLVYRNKYEITKFLLESGAKVTDKEIKAAKPHRKSKLLCNTAFQRKLRK